MTIKILLADDHRMVRQGLKLLLERHSQMKVVAEAEDGLTAVRLAREHGPQVAIIDVSMPGLNGIEATRKILAHCPGTKVIGLSMYSDRRYVIEMLRSGALGYILKDSAFDELVQAISTVMENQTYLSARIADVIIKDYIKGVEGSKASAFSKLTNREREVLQQLAEGRSTKQIAAQMDLSIKTVETYRKKIMDKLHLYSLAELTKYAVREGITSL